MPDAAHSETFDVRLRTAMEARNLSVAALSRESGLKVRSIFRWRAGDSVPGAEALPLLSRALGCTTDWLCGASDLGGPDAAHPQPREAQ